MLQWIKQSSIPPIYISFVLIWIYFAVHLENLFICLISLLLVARLYMLCIGKNRQIVLAILILFTGFFLLSKELSNRHMVESPTQVNQVLLLPDTIKVNGDSLSFRGKTDGQIYQVYYKLKSQAEKSVFQGLSELLLLKVEGSLEFPESQRNFSGFDYQSYLKTQGIYRILKVDNILSSHSVFSINPIEWLSMWRRKAIVSIKKNFPNPMSNYMTGLLFGFLDTDFYEMNNLYSSLGIIHLFALSGMQVGFFMDGFCKILLRLGLKQETVRKWQYPFSFFYAGMTGFSVSVVRSLLQKLLAELGVSKLDNFGLTILLLFIIMPNFLLTAGGVLSCAYAFILTITDFSDMLSWRRTVVESMTISLGILPILIFYFGEFQPWSIFLTFVFSVIFDSFLLPSLTIIFFLSPFIKLNQCNIFFDCLENVIRLVAHWASKPIVLGQPTPILLISMLIFLGILYDMRKKKKYIICLSFILFFLFFQSKYPLENEVTMIDIGQGDSIFLRDWTGKTILIDVGGRVEVGRKEEWRQRQVSSNAERTLIPYLKSRGVARIDVLVLTHTDTDHIGDLEQVANHFAIKSIYVSKGSLTQADFVKRLKRLRSKIHPVEVGDKIAIFDSQLEVLYPTEIGNGGNDDSIVLYGEFLKTKFLFTGDLEEQGESEFIKRFPTLKVDVLKAGHHGSSGSSSSAFLEVLHPKIALISAGQHNYYNHPHQETLERFKNIGSQIYRTDQQGSIRFRGWRSWSVETVR